jgi:transposase
VIGAVSGKKFKRTSIVSALIGNRPIEPLQYTGSMDSALFETWFETRLLPALPKNTTIVMDNASFHRKSRLIPLAELAGHTILFLPPYSPELNLIENFWAWLKTRLRKILHLFDGLDSAISDCFHVR